MGSDTPQNSNEGSSNAPATPEPAPTQTQTATPVENRTISPAYQQPIIVQTQSTWQRFSGWLGWTGFMICGFLLMSMTIRYYDYFDTTGGIEERFHSGSEVATDKIAIINVSGVIMAGTYVKQQIDRVRKDSNVKAIVLRVDSPGGTVTGSDYIYHHLKKLREDKDIPIVVSMGGMATSGGYYVAMAVGDQEKSIYAEETTTTGSIGVIIPHYNVTGLMAKYDVVDDSIASHQNKQMLSMTREMTPEQRELIQEYVNEAFGLFKRKVQEGRPVFRDDPSALDQLATGAIFTAGQAKKYNLIDEIGFIEEAIERAAELAKVSVDSVRVVQFKSPPSLLDLTSMAADKETRLTNMLNLSAPRAYFLTTTLPPLVTSHELHRLLD